MGKIRAAFNHPPVPMPVCLVGANVGGKPNFEAIAWFSFVDYNPYCIGVSSEKSHFTNKGIVQNKTFSVNMPSSELVAATDYCGITSGEKIDKSKIFDVFYGDLKTAPMINECPANVECKLIHTINLSHTDLFIGEIANIYIDEECLRAGKPDLKRLNPLILEDIVGDYWSLGEKVAKAFVIGKKFEPKNF